MKLIEFLPAAEALVKELACQMNHNHLGLKEVEEQILMLINQVAHELMQMVVGRIDEPTFANSIVVNGKNARFRNIDSLSLKDRFGGEVVIIRRRYGIAGGGSMYPLDDRIGISRCHGFTPLMTYLQAYFGACDAFVPAHALKNDHAIP